MSFSLYLYQRLAEGNGYDRDLTKWAKNTWRRSTRAKGGYWTGGFVISGVSDLMLQDLYSTMIGKRVRETSYSIPTWEGEIVGLTLVLNGIRQEQSLDTELWHNWVTTEFTEPRVLDTEQGALTFNPVANSFQDAGQDFSDWTALGNEIVVEVFGGGALYVQAYLGAHFTTTNPNDSIYVYKDSGRGTAGWNGTIGGGTPLSYDVQYVGGGSSSSRTALNGSRASSDIYGESFYVEVLMGVDAATARASRDRRVSANAYPRSLATGGFASGANQEPEQDRLEVQCAGYVASMNRSYYWDHTGLEDISDQISTLVGESEFVTAGSILSNTSVEVALDGSVSGFRLWDQIEELIDVGNSSGNRYVGGVYSGRVFNYDLAATEWLYAWRNGRLVYNTGHPVPPTLIEPNIIVRVQAPLAAIPPGGTAWGDILTAYITEVEFIAPNGYTLIPGEADILTGSG